MKLKRWKVLCGKYLGSSSGERLHSVMKGEWVVIPIEKGNSLHKLPEVLQMLVNCRRKVSQYCKNLGQVNRSEKRGQRVGVEQSFIFRI